MKINKYPDGSSYIAVAENQNKLMDTAFNKVFRINSYEDLWHLNQYVDACLNVGVKPEITIPCLLDAQADRRFADNQSSGLKLVCKFLTSMDADFKIYHPHNPELVEALMDNVEIIDNSEFITKVLDILPDGSPPYGQTDDLILMSSDAGGFKPLMKLADSINWLGETFSASKSRKYENGESNLIQKIYRDDFEGKDILIIDDLSIGGGTFKGLSTMLKERNCGKLYLAVSHMTIANLGNDSVTNYFDKIYTTNSKGYAYYWKGMTVDNNLEIINLF